MATYTSNYNFKKPDEQDLFLLSDFNNNWDSIDANLKSVSDSQANATAQSIKVYDETSTDPKNRTVTLPNITSMTDLIGKVIFIRSKASSNVTGPFTLQVNGLDEQYIFGIDYQGNEPAITNDLPKEWVTNNQIYCVTFDGTKFLLLTHNMSIATSINSERGIVKLTDSLTSTAQDTAISAYAAKQINDELLVIEAELNINNPATPDVFKFAIKTDVATADAVQAEVPFKPNGTYDCWIYWGDGQATYVNSADGITNSAGVLHTYSTPGSYHVTIVGSFDTFRADTNLTFQETLISVISSLLSVINNGDLTNFFSGCANLEAIPSHFFNSVNKQVINYSNAFEGCASLTGSTPITEDGLELWELAGTTGYPATIMGTDCFVGDLGLTNFNEIPIAWGGGLYQLSVARAYLTAATDGNGNVLFGGGSTGSGNSSVVEKYSTRPSMKILTNLSTARTQLSAATDGNGNVLFGGGNYITSVNKYNLAGTRTTLTGLSVARGVLTAATDANGNVLFGGGSTGSEASDVVDAYDTSGTRTTLASLSLARYFFAAATDGNGNVLFGGGYTGSAYSGVVDKYDTTGTRTTLTGLSTARSALAAATDGSGSVLFGGGNTGSASSVVNKYDTSGTRTTLTALSATRLSLASATDGNGNVLFGGGYSGSTVSAVVNKYDTTGTRTTLSNLKQARRSLAAATDGDGNVLFGGGYTDASGTILSGVIDKYLKS